MRLVLQSPEAHGLTPQFVAEIASITQAEGTQAAAPGVVRLAGVAHGTVTREIVRDRCEAQRVDYAFIPDVSRLADYRLVVMDMDSTLITIECVDEIADLVGKKAEVSAITEAAMRGEIADYQESLRRRVALLKGVDATALDRIYEERLRLSPGAERMLQAIQAKGLKTLLVSGGFTEFTDRLKARLKLDHTRSNLLGVEDGKLTGEVLGDIVDAEAKRATVLSLCARLGCEPSQAIVLGDGANDLKMMAVAGISVAFRAKPIVRAQTTHALNFVGLDGLLHWFDDCQPAQ
jgi:phosphoserine phosphatase